MRLKVLLLACLPLLACAAGCRALGGPDPLELTPATLIVVPNDKPANDIGLAAEELQTWLRKATNSEAGFRIVPGENLVVESNRPVIMLGDTRALDHRLQGKLGPHGYALRRKNSAIVIAGDTPAGAYYGAMAFLDRFCGVRFYMPTDLFTSLPAERRVALGDVDVTVVPFVTSCYMSGINHDDPWDSRWVKRVGGWRRLGGTHQHNMYNVFPAEKYAKRWPEIYPILDGKRYFPKSQKDQAWQPCFSEPRLVDAAVESAKAYFKKHPDHQYLSFSIQDSHAFCECPRCMKIVNEYQAKDPELGRAKAHSIMYWRFMNKLAARLDKEVPSKRITGLAYSLTRIAPPFKLHPNIVVFTNYHLAEMPSDNFMKPGPNGVSPLDNWLGIASHYGNHDWYQGGGYLMPRIYTGFWVQFLRHLKKRLPEAYMHAECYPNWGLDGPKLYILSRLFWDPDEDVNKLLAQFCGDMFGPAAEPMQKYFMTLEELWDRLDNIEGPERKLFRWDTQFLTTQKSRAMLNRCRYLLDKAAAAAESDPQRKRIGLFSRSFRMSEYLFALARPESATKETYQEAGKYIDRLARNDVMAYHWRTTKGAAKAVYWSSIRGRYQPFRVPRIPGPTLGGARGTAWANAARVKDFILKDGGQDPKGTTAQMGHDGEFLYLSVTCPHKDPSRLIETDDKSWRSDNVELFVDNDDNKFTFERHLWVKTNGRVVDWPPRPRKGADRIRAAVRKGKDRYVIRMALPFEYLGAPATPGTRFRVQVLRNEFAKGKVRNELKYAALWSGELIVE